MNSTYLVTSEDNDCNNQSSLDKSIDHNAYTNCVIANDAPKKIDFLILVIETLQINATDSLFLRAKKIGLPNDFSSPVAFWKMRCSNPLRKSYSFSSLSADQIDSMVELISSTAGNL